MRSDGCDLACFVVFGIGINLWTTGKMFSGPVTTKDKAPLTEADRERITRKVGGSPSVATPLTARPMPDPGKITPRSITGTDYSVILEEYESNEIAADQRYKGRRVRVKGPISSIGKDILGAPYVTIGKPLQTLQCVFPRASVDYLASLSKGEFISVECVVSGKLINVILKDCTP
jgi:hypothetical protein